MKWPWFAVIGVSLLLTGCHERFPVCPHPGGVIQKVKYPPDLDEDKNDNKTGEYNDNCYWLLTITRNKAKNPTQEVWDNDVWGTVAKSVVDANRKRLKMWRYDYQMEDYYFHELPIFLTDPNDKDKLEIGQDYYFVGSPDSPRLKLTADKDLPQHKNELPQSALGKSGM